MQFILLKQLPSEIDAELLRGKLLSEGIEVKLDIRVAGSYKSSQPKVFGVYVREKDLAKARQIALENVPLVSHDSSDNLKMYSRILVAITTFGIVWALVQMFKTLNGK